MKIVLVGAQDLEPECTHWKGIRLGMEANDIDYHEIDWRTNPSHVVQEEINSLDADLLIWGLLEPFENPSFVKQCHAKMRALWHADLRDTRIGGYPNWDMRDQIDMIFLSNNGLRDFYQENTKVPTYYVGQAGFKGELVPTTYGDKDVVFIGGKIDSGILGQRMKLIKDIDHWITHINKDTLPDRMKIYEQMPSIYSSAKICFDASQIWDIDKYCSARYFHIAANGGFSICKRFPGCEELFPDCVGKVYFDTAEEANDLIEHYLKPENEETRQRIADRGQKHALKWHTYTNRVEDIIDLIT